MSSTNQHERSTLARIRRSRADMGIDEHSTFRPLIMLGISVLIVAACLIGGCRRSSEQEPEPELEAIDVGPALVIGTESDQTAIGRPPELVGILPEDFPEDLPIYLPASLVDFGSTDDRWVFVNLLTPHSLARVERELSARLTRQGWTAASSGGVQQLRKGNSRARLRVENARPGTQYRFEYPG